MAALLPPLALSWERRTGIVISGSIPPAPPDGLSEPEPRPSSELDVAGGFAGFSGWDGVTGVATSLPAVRAELASLLDRGAAAEPVSSDPVGLAFD